MLLKLVLQVLIRVYSLPTAQLALLVLSVRTPVPAPWLVAPAVTVWADLTAARPAPPAITVP